MDMGKSSSSSSKAISTSLLPIPRPIDQILVVTRAVYLVDTKTTGEGSQRRPVDISVIFNKPADQEGGPLVKWRETGFARSRETLFVAFMDMIMIHNNHDQAPSGPEGA